MKDATALAGGLPTGALEPISNVACLVLTVWQSKKNNRKESAMGLNSLRGWGVNQLVKA